MKRLLLTLALILLPLGTAIADTSAQPKTEPTGEGELISPETQTNYQELQKFLTQGNWRRANDVTYDLVLKIASRDQQGWLSIEDMTKLPCSDLKIINDLWTKYSQGRFGWSAQYPIFRETNNRPGKLNNDTNYEVFGDRIGWRVDGNWIIFKENLTYSLDAPQGHLPSLRNAYDLGGGRLAYTMLTKRIVECRIVPEN
jgi:hypothetical protein